MSKVSVTGARSVMGDVVETTHDLNVLHLNDYEGHWEGFDNGDPMAGGDEASEMLVTVRSLQSILGVEEDDAGPSRILKDEQLESELEEIRTEVNELEDRRSNLEGDLRDVRERIDAMEPFADLGIDLDLLYGYDSLAVQVGEGDADSVERVLADVEAPSQVFAGDGVVAAFARTDDGTLQSALVEADVSALEVPDGEGDPEEYLDELRHERQKIESNLSTVESQLEDLRYDVAGFLLAAEEKLAVEAQKAEAPLSFATTDNAFVAEGWLPSERVDEFETTVNEAVDGHVHVEELEVAAYDRHGHGHTEAAAAETEQAGVVDAEPPADALDGEESESEAESDERPQQARADGGTVTMGAADDPPTVQDNPSTIKPFELLTRAVGRPSYSEFDPTILLFLTFPLMFGFIIGDTGYGIIYTAIGYYIYANFDSDAFSNLGIITIAAGVSTTIFGVLYGELFGLHILGEQLWVNGLGMSHPPIEKGLSPATGYWARAWFVVTVLFGILHLNTAYALSFVENTQLHGVKEAVIESGSWILALNGLWLFVFSRLFDGAKPDFLFEVFGSGDTAAFHLGFTGFPTEVGMLGGAMVLAGMALLALGPAHELVEIHVVLAHALSYLRIAAVLLAKAGMAFAVNLLFFGAYQHHGEFHYMLDYGPQYVQNNYEGATVIFGGMFHGSPAMLVFGVLVLILGHIVVLILGVTSSGIQSIRLEYFEFFEKFYDGDGETYSPFGRERVYTRDQ
ncbi:V-type ATP synthase subunit I [Halosimplex litoreum]|uniref:A-type ATP synthase subunit I n=1 Tax=Halosimplex litoreum TaxID=1198301 RepID=A0A7T3FVC4_9EURY|nr:V-type ATP synthase subunit I [Halosimplex litoreum]QPV61207.1 V-type ATP synthase subunit I [Halosimplex litoreum]